MKMKSIKNLIVGVDLSEYSDLVVREAKQLAAQLKLSVVYVYVYEDVDLYEEGIKIDKTAIAKMYNDKIRARYGIEDHDKVLIRFGKPEKEILAVAKKEKQPLILVGHKSGHAVARFFLGSVAENLAANTSFPLWIHRGEKVLLPRKILVPSDLSARSIDTISELQSIKKKFNSDLEIYHVMNEPVPILDYQAWAMIENEIKKADDAKVKSFKKKHPSLKVVRGTGAVVESIQKHSKKFDLIAISPRPKSKVSFGRVSGKIVRSGDTPVLVVP